MPPDEEWHVLLLLLNQLPHAYHWQMPSWISNCLLASLCYLLPGPNPWIRWVERWRVTEAFQVKTTMRNSHMYTIILDKQLSVDIKHTLADFSTQWMQCSPAADLWITSHMYEMLSSFKLFCRLRLFTLFFVILHINQVETYQLINLSSWVPWNV